VEEIESESKGKDIRTENDNSGLLEYNMDKNDNNQDSNLTEEIAM